MLAVINEYRQVRIPAFKKFLLVIFFIYRLLESPFSFLKIYFKYKKNSIDYEKRNKKKSLHVKISENIKNIKISVK